MLEKDIELTITLFNNFTYNPLAGTGFFSLFDFFDNSWEERLGSSETRLKIIKLMRDGIQEIIDSASADDGVILFEDEEILLKQTLYLLDKMLLSISGQMDFLDILYPI